MIFPVRCFTCGKVISQKYTTYVTLQEAGMPIPEIYNEIGIRKLCCKRMFCTHVEAIDHFAKYTELPDKIERTTSVDHNRQYRAR